MKKMSVLFETKQGTKKIINFETNDIYDQNKPVSKQLKFFSGLCKKCGFKNEDVTRIKFFNGPEIIESLALSKFVNLKRIEITEGTKILRWAFLGEDHFKTEKSVSVVLPNSLKVDKSDNGFVIDPFFGCELKYVFIDNNPEVERLIKEKHPEATIIYDHQNVNNNSQDQENVADNDLENESTTTSDKDNFENSDQKFEKVIINNSQDQENVADNDLESESTTTSDKDNFENSDQKFEKVIINNSQDQENVADNDLESESITTSDKDNFENSDQKFEKVIINNSQDQKTKCLETKDLVSANKNDDIKNKPVNKYKDKKPEKNVNTRSYSELLTIKSIFLPYFFYMLIIITWHKIFNPVCNNKIQTKNYEIKQASLYKETDQTKEKLFLSDSNLQIPSCSKNKSNYNTERGYF